MFIDRATRFLSSSLLALTVLASLVDSGVVPGQEPTSRIGGWRSSIRKPTGAVR